VAYRTSNRDWDWIYLLYDGDMLVAELNAYGQVVAEYVWGSLGPVARIAGGRVQLYVCDALGHVRALIDAQTGQITDRYDYDAWGNVVHNGTTRQPFTWNGAYGYEWMPEVSLYHVGARAYDPRTARWLQRDPIDAASGDPNLYRYCGNDPINQVDPDGTNWTYHDLLDAAGFIPVVGEIADLANAVGYALEGDWVNAGISAAGVIPVVGDLAKAGRVGKKVVQELVERGSGQAAKRQAKNAPQQQSTNQSVNYSSSAHKFGGNNPHAQKGRQAHDQFKQKARQKGWEVEKVLIDPATGKKCRPDAITPKGHPVELKPNTPSGRRRGKKQIEMYERAARKRGRVIYY